MFKKLQSSSSGLIRLDTYKFDFPGPGKSVDSSREYTAMGRTHENFNSRTDKRKLKQLPEARKLSRSPNLQRNPLSRAPTLLRN